MLLTKRKNYKLYVDVCREEQQEEKKLTELTFSNLELLHEIVMCSLPQQRLPGEKCARYRSELAYRIYLLETALDVQGDLLRKSRKTAHLDSSEKSLIHYYLGMAFTKLIARRMFGVDYLLHLSVIPDPKAGYLSAPGSNRNDLIGGRLLQDGAYSVWSVKGRSQNSQTAMQIGCREVCDFQFIGRETPQLRAVCMTYYENGYLNAIVKLPQKPDPEKNRQVKVDFGREDYLKAYYSGVCGMYSEEGKKQNYRQDKKFFEDGIATGIPLFSLGEGEKARTLHVGMPQSLLKSVRQTEGQVEDCLRKLCWQETLDGGKYLGEDMVYIY